MTSVRRAVKRNYNVKRQDCRTVRPHWTVHWRRCTSATALGCVWPWSVLAWHKAKNTAVLPQFCRWLRRTMWGISRLFFRNPGWCCLCYSLFWISHTGRPQIDSQRLLKCVTCKLYHTHQIFLWNRFLSQSHFTFFPHPPWCALCGCINVGIRRVYSLCVCFRCMHKQDCENMSIWRILTMKLWSFFNNSLTYLYLYMSVLCVRLCMFCVWQLFPFTSTLSVIMFICPSLGCVCLCVYAYVHVWVYASSISVCVCLCAHYVYLTVYICNLYVSIKFRCMSACYFYIFGISPSVCTRSQWHVCLHERTWPVYAFFVPICTKFFMHTCVLCRVCICVYA